MALHTGRETYISLYTGGGGLDLGFRLANPEAKCVLYVERELPAAALMVDHIKAGLMDAAPVWSDTGTLDCRPFADKVDWIIGGFPCQPFSVAGKQRGIEDKRWLWEHIRRLAVEIRPRYLFLENTPGVLARSGIGTVLGELSEIGYDAEWMCVRASDVGAPHRRERVFILAMDNNQSGGGQRVSKRRLNDVERGSRELAHTRHDARRSEQEQQHEVETAGAGQSSTDMAHCDNRLSDRPIEEVRAGRSPSVDGSEQLGNAKSQRLEGRAGAKSKQERPGQTERTMANSSSPGLQRGLLGRGTNEERRAESDGRTSTSNEPMGNARSEGREGSYNDGETSDRIQQKPSERRSELANPVSKRGRGWHTGGQYAEHAFPPGPGAGAEWRDVISRRPDLAPAVGNSEGDYKQRHRKPESERTTRDNRRKSTRRRGSDIYNGTTGRDQETPEPAVRGVADGMARGLARSTQLRILGNGVVPHQAALAFHILKERITNGTASASKQHRQDSQHAASLHQ